MINTRIFAVFVVCLLAGALCASFLSSRDIATSMLLDPATYLLHKIEESRYVPIRKAQ